MNVEYTSISMSYFYNYGDYYEYEFYICIFYNDANLINPVKYLCPNVYVQEDMQRNSETIVPDVDPGPDSC